MVVKVVVAEVRGCDGRVGEYARYVDSSVPVGCSYVSVVTDSHRIVRVAPYNASNSW